MVLPLLIMLFFNSAIFGGSSYLQMVKYEDIPLTIARVYIYGDIEGLKSISTPYLNRVINKRIARLSSKKFVAALRKKVNNVLKTRVKSIFVRKDGSVDMVFYIYSKPHGRVIRKWYKINLKKMGDVFYLNKML